VTELNEDLSINLYEMPLRKFDPAIARWLTIDPVTHFSMSPYNGYDNNPIFWADPTGADGENLTFKLKHITPPQTAYPFPKSGTNGQHNHSFFD